MTFEAAVRLLGYLEILVVTYPVTLVLVIALTMRLQRRGHDKWMQLYGDDELKARWRKMEAKLEAKDEEIAALKADKGALVAIIRCATGANIRTQEQLAGVHMIVRRGKK